MVVAQVKFRSVQGYALIVCIKYKQRPVPITRGRPLFFKDPLLKEGFCRVVYFKF